MGPIFGQNLVNVWVSFHFPRGTSLPKKFLSTPPGMHLTYKLIRYKITMFCWFNQLNPLLTRSWPLLAQQLSLHKLWRTPIHLHRGVLLHLVSELRGGCAGGIQCGAAQQSRSVGNGIHVHLSYVLWHGRKELIFTIDIERRFWTKHFPLSPLAAYALDVVKGISTFPFVPCPNKRMTSCPTRR